MCSSEMFATVSYTAWRVILKIEVFKEYIFQLYGNTDSIVTLLSCQLYAVPQNKYTMGVSTYIHHGLIWHRNKFPGCECELLVGCGYDEGQTALKWDRSSHPVAPPGSVSHTFSLKYFGKCWIYYYEREWFKSCWCIIHHDNNNMVHNIISTTLTAQYYVIYLWKSTLNICFRLKELKFYGQSVMAAY
jgi:hypothetical protein